MAYLALYRQHRPRTLGEVVDQSHIVRTLSNAIMNNKLVHAYLFTGPRGTGKTTIARVLSRSLNCAQGPTVEPCGACISCLSIDTGSALDVREIDAASNRGIDDIRDLRQSIHYVPESRYRVYIIDEVHMLSTEAFNALLKTLEEPPDHVVFILATTEVHKVPLTILSRCQRFDFHRIGASAMKTYLTDLISLEQSTISNEAIDLLVERSQGGLRDALSMLDQCLIYASGEINANDLLAVLGSVDQQTLEQLVSLLIVNKVPELLELLDTIEDSGRDLMQLLFDLMRLMRSYVAAREVLALDITPSQALQALDLLSRAEPEMKIATQPRIALELALLRIAEELPHGGRIEALEARVAALEAGGRPMMHPTAANPPREKRSNVTPKPSPVPAPVVEPAVAVEPAKAPNTATADAFPVSSSTGGATTEASGSFSAEWEVIMERIKKERIALHAILINGRILDQKGEVLELVFVEEFHKRIVEKSENIALLEHVVADICGVPCKVKVFLTKDLVPSSGSGRRSAPRVKSDTADSGSLNDYPTGQDNEDLLVTSAFALVGEGKVKIVTGTVETEEEEEE